MTCERSESARERRIALYTSDQQEKKATCSGCFIKGHLASSCTNDIVCRTCKQTGHQSGHPSCPLRTDSSSSSTVVERPQTAGPPAPKQSRVMSSLPRENHSSHNDNSDEHRDAVLTSHSTKAWQSSRTRVKTVNFQLPINAPWETPTKVPHAATRLLQGSENG